MFKIWLLSLIFVLFNIIKVEHNIANTEECLQSFADFAYPSFEDWSINSDIDWGWQLVANIPNDLDESYAINYPLFSTELSRIIDGQQEIWISGFNSSGHSWFIYNLDTGNWKTIPKTIIGTNLQTGNLFSINDEAILSSVTWNIFSDSIDLETAPIFSKFNEEKGLFEILEIDLSIPVLRERFYFGKSVSVFPKIIFDNSGIFWIIINFDGIYRYDSISPQTNKVTDLFNYPIQDAVLDRNHGLYLSVPSKSLFSLSDETLLYFNPALNDITEVHVPDEPWLEFFGMGIDQINRLWLGAIGYIDSDRIWHLIHPNPEYYLANAGNMRYGPPELILISSDNRLWYMRYTDGSREGVAWYNPETGEGCMFTGRPANIIEDNNQTLWMVIDGNLYKYSLND